MSTREETDMNPDRSPDMSTHTMPDEYGTPPLFTDPLAVSEVDPTYQPSRIWPDAVVLRDPIQAHLAAGTHTTSGRTTR